MNRMRYQRLLLGTGFAALVWALLVAGNAASGGTGSTSVAAQSAYTTATRLCGVLRPREMMAGQQRPDSRKARALSHPHAIGDVELAGGLIYVDTGPKNAINLLRRSGALVRTIPISWKQTVDSFAVAPDGSLYMQRYPFDLVKVSQSGRVVWSASQPHQITGVFGHRLGSTWVVGAISDNVARLYDSAGRYVGSRQVHGGASFSEAPDGGLVTTDGFYVRKYDAQLQLQFYFGGSGAAGHPAPGQYDFYLEGGAIQLRDGRYLVADSGHGLELFSPRGILLGKIPDTQLGLTESSTLRISGSTLYLAIGKPFSDSQRLMTIPLADAVREAQQSGGQGLPLGIGAGVSAKAADSYFPQGTRPRVAAAFDPWWAQLRNLSLQYTVENETQAERGGGETHTIALTPTVIRRGAALSLPAAVPGPYQIDVRLYEGRTAVGAQCGDYAVGAAGDQLDFSTLPGSWNAGGVSGDRGAALSRILGMRGVRISLDWRQMLPKGNSGPTDYSAYDAEIAAASKEAAALGVPLSVQVGSGGPERTFVDNGTWAERVTQLVQHWKDEVHYWEAWNEPNATFGTPADYVNKVLAPFYTAVKGADPTAMVIGGTVVGMELSYWQGIAQAGGFNFMDIAAVHPYTGHNRSWEEEGDPAAFQALRSLMDANGAATMPIWITELAWWSDGPNDFFGQADRVVRAQLWAHILDIPVWEYFIPQGTAGNLGLSYSLIEDDSLVKPAALGAMVEAREIGGRQFGGWLTTGMPLTYVAQFGPSTPGGGTVVALWTDDVELAATVRLASGGDPSATLVNEYGAAERVSLARPLRLTLGGSVQYLEVPSGDQVSVQPPEPFGRDVALAQNGTTASASSSTPWNPPQRAIDGDFGAANVGDLADSPAWASAYGDRSPELTVRLARVERIDRVLLATSSVGSVMPGIRSWKVQVRETSGTWRTVGGYSNLFYNRAALTTFAPTLASAVRIVVKRINFGGYVGGAEPWFWPRSTAAAARKPNDYAYGPAVIRELAVYAAP